MRKFFSKIKNSFYNFLKYGILIIPIFFVLNIPSAKADIVWQQTGTSTSGNFDSSCYAYNVKPAYYQNKNLISITTKAQLDAYYHAKAYVYSYPGGNLIASSDLMSGQGGGWRDYDFIFSGSNQIALTDSDYLVAFSMTDWDGYGHLYLYQGTNISVGSSNGSIYLVNNGKGCPASLNFWGSGIYTQYMTINAGTPPPEISIQYPINNVSLGGDFTHWQLYTTSTSFFSGTEKVIYGKTASTMIYSDSQGIIMSAGTGATDYLLKLNPLTGINYAQALLLDDSNAIVASSTIISFEATGFQTNYTGQQAGSTSTLSYDYNYNSTSTLMWSGTTWTCPVNLFGFSTLDICATAQYLVMPQKSDLDKFINLKNLLSSKAPFAYFYELQSIYDNAVSNGGSGNFPTLSINTNGTPLAMNIVIFSKDTIEKFAGSSNVQLFRSLIGYSLWLGFAYLVYYEIRNFRRKREEHR